MRIVEGYLSVLKKGNFETIVFLKRALYLWLQNYAGFIPSELVTGKLGCSFSAKGFLVDVPI